MNTWFDLVDMEIDTKIPQECFDDIHRFTPEHWAYTRWEQLFDRYVFRVIESLENSNKKEFKDIVCRHIAFPFEHYVKNEDESDDWYIVTINNVTKMMKYMSTEDIAEYVYESVDCCSDEFLDYQVNVYMWD